LFDKLSISILVVLNDAIIANFVMLES